MSNNNQKRKDYLEADEFFISLSILSCYRSKDPSTRNGATIVNPITKRVLSLGYNGLPFHCSDDEFPWGREDADPNNTKYPYVVHAERNAIYNSLSKSELRGSTLILFSERGYHPCSICAQSIIQHEISRVILCHSRMDLGQGYDLWFNQNAATIRMFKAAKISIDVYPSLISVLEKVETYFRNTRLELEKYQTTPNQ